LALYQQLLNSTEKSSPFYNEVLANYYACHAALAMAEKKPFEELENSRKIPSFEAAYNIAVGLAALGRNDRATERLKMATNACKASLKQAGYTENEINEELACIEVQTAYILQKQSITGEARKIYEKVLNSKYVFLNHLSSIR
jgi:hypothetical protein